MATGIEAAHAQYYPCLIDDAVTYARELIDEWDYDEDPFGYCHRRPMLLALVEEVERHRPELRNQPGYQP